MAPKRKGGGGGGDKKAAFWDAIANQKLPTIRWSLLNAGVEPTTRNEDGLTSMMLAITAGKDKSLMEIIQFYERRAGQLRSALAQRDEEAGRTPLLLAAHHGRRECVRLLLDAGAALAPRDEDGTALDNARRAKKQACVDILEEGMRTRGRLELDDGEAAAAPVATQAL